MEKVIIAESKTYPSKEQENLLERDGLYFQTVTGSSKESEAENEEKEIKRLITAIRSEPLREEIKSYSRGVCREVAVETAKATAREVIDETIERIFARAKVLIWPLFGVICMLCVSIFGVVYSNTKQLEKSVGELSIAIASFHGAIDVLNERSRNLEKRIDQEQK